MVWETLIDGAIRIKDNIVKNEWLELKYKDIKKEV